MAIGLILLLSLLAVVKSTPNLFVTVTGEVSYNGTSRNVEVHFGGKDKTIITDQVRFNFQIGDDGLKKCVQKYFGRRPNDAYVRSPTPWGDLYSTYGWSQVHKILKPVKATIQNVETKKEAISTKVYKNSRSTPATARVSISRAYENRLTTEWSVGEEFTRGTEISISAKLDIVDIGASSSISKAKSWGRRDEYSQATTITDAAELEVQVPPFSSVYVKSQLYKTTVKVWVEYEASLEGNTAVNYNPVFKSHHFHRLDINDVMRSCGLRTQRTVTEDINLDLVTGATIEAVDGPPTAFNSTSITGSLNLEVIEV